MKIRIRKKEKEMRKIIGKNQRKRAEQIFANAQNIQAFTLNNSFKAKPCNREDYEGNNWMLKEWNDFRFAKLTQEGDNKYCLYIHGNCWYDFTN